MNTENGVLLWLIPQGCNIEIGSGYDNMIGCAKVVSVSILYYWFLITGVYIYSINTTLYPYTLPLTIIPYLYSNLCLSVTWALA